MTVILRENSGKPIEIIQDVPGYELLGLTIFEDRPGPIKMSDLLREQGIHLTEEDIAQGRKLEENSERVPGIEAMDSLPNYKSLNQVWVKGIEFYVSIETGEVFSQCTDQADFETGVTKVTEEYREEILRNFNEIRSWMEVNNRKDLAKRLRGAFSSLRRSGIVPIRDQGYSQYPIQEGELIRKLKEKGQKGYAYISRPADKQNLEICYGSAEEEKEEFWPYPNFLIRDVVNQVTSSFQENGVPYIFRGDIYSPIIIPLNSEDIK